MPSTRRPIVSARSNDESPRPPVGVGEQRSPDATTDRGSDDDRGVPPDGHPAGRPPPSTHPATGSEPVRVAAQEPRGQAFATPWGETDSEEHSQSRKQGAEMSTFGEFSRSENGTTEELIRRSETWEPP